jgi:hypothetical protein
MQDLEDGTDPSDYVDLWTRIAGAIMKHARFIEDSLEITINIIREDGYSLDRSDLEMESGLSDDQLNGWESYYWNAPPEHNPERVLVLKSKIKQTEGGIIFNTFINCAMNATDELDLQEEL